MSDSEHSIDPAPAGPTSDLRPLRVHAGRQTGLDLNLREWIGQHWRGELPLATSYWLNNFLGNLLAYAVIFGVTIALSFARNLLVLFPTLAATWAVILGVAVWQIVGTWRSATRSARESGGRFWPWVAKLMMILAVLGHGKVFIQQGIPQLDDGWQAAIGDPAYGPRGVRTLRDGTELELSGGFAHGQAAAFKAALDAAPHAHVLHLDSIGGRIVEAIKIRDMMVARGMDTVVDRACASACTIVFLGGQRRWLGEGAVLGFHSAHYAGINAPSLNGDFRTAFANAGVQSWFAATAMGTPSTSLWKPTEAQLLDAHVVTDRAPVGMFALAGMGPTPTAESVVALLDATPGLQALRRADGARWSEVEQAWTRAALEGRPATEAQALLNAHMQAAVMHLRARVPDDVARALGDLSVRELGAVQRVDPEACWRYDTTGDIDIKPLISPELQALDASLASRILTEGALHPVEPPSGSEGERLRGKALALGKARGIDSRRILAAFDSGAPHAGVCPASISLFSLAAGLPPNEGASLIRFLLKGKG